MEMSPHFFGGRFSSWVTFAAMVYAGQKTGPHHAALSGIKLAVVPGVGVAARR